VCREKIKNVRRGENTRVAAKEAKKQESAWNSLRAPTRVSTRMKKKTKVGRSQRKDKGEKLSSGSHSS